MFEHSADIYDALYAHRDHAGDVAAAAEAIAIASPVEVTRVLDAACATGRHAACLALRYASVEGFDVDAALVAVARANHPQLPFHIADLTSVALKVRFDAITCFYGAVAYLISYKRLRSAVNALCSMLTADGVVAIEPWRTASEHHDGSTVRVVDEADVKIARLGYAERRGQSVRLQVHLLVERAGEVTYRNEVHRLALFEDSAFARVASELGLSHRKLIQRGRTFHCYRRS